MKTYSRKNSSYLKKAFIASNFNEMCRLCLSEVDMVLTPIIQDHKICYQEWIQYSVDIVVEEGDGLPPNICEECLGMVEQTYLFKKKCKASDSKLREHLELMEVSDGSRLNKIGFGDLEEHEHLFSKRQSTVSKCDESNAVDSGGTTMRSVTVSSTETDSHITPEGEKGSKNLITEEVQEEEDEENKEEEKKKEDKKKEEKKKEEKKKEEKKEEENKKKEKKKEEENKKKEKKEEEKKAKEVKEKVSKEEENKKNNKVTNKESQGIVKHVKRYILRGEKKANTAATADNDDDEEDLTVYEVVPVDKNDETQFSMECETSTNPNEDMCLSPGPARDKPETTIQEIYQQWDNEEECEDSNQGENDEEEFMVLDVVWEDEPEKPVKQKEAPPVLEVDQSGVVELHRVYTTKNQIDIIETVPSDKRFSCCACPADFPTSPAIMEHLAIAHNIPDAAHCSICYKTFTCPNSLRRHMSVHTGFKPYKCSVCNRTFSQSSILKRHVLTHNVSKPFSCHVCKKSYTQKMNLLAHLKNHGYITGIDNFTCQLCNKSFVHQSGLSRHIKLHKGVRFMCIHCKRSFVDASALARHIKAIHQKKKPEVGVS